jgi:hypothetical protein
MAATAATVAVAAVMVVAGATRMSDAVAAITDAVAAVASALAWAAVAVAAAAAAMLTDAAGATRTGTEPTSSGHPERPEKTVSGQAAHCEAAKVLGTSYHSGYSSQEYGYTSAGQAAYGSHPYLRL